MGSPQVLDSRVESGYLRAGWSRIRPLRLRAADALGRVASLDPVRAIRLSDLVVRVLMRVGMRRVVTRIYGEIPGTAAAREEVVVRWARGHIVRKMVEHGSADRLAGLARWTNVERLSSALAARKPIILIYPYSDLMSLMHSRAHDLGIPVSVIRNEGPQISHRSVRFATRSEPTNEGRALMLLKARAQLRAGGAVMAAFHAYFDPGSEELTIQGRRVTLPLGLFTLARLTGAEIFPVVPRWANPTRVEFSIREALTAEPTDVALLRQAAAWLDRHLSLEPLDLTFATHLWLSQSPAAPSNSEPKSESGADRAAG